MYPVLALNYWSCCLYLPGAGMTGMCPPPRAFLFVSRSHIVQTGLQPALRPEAKNDVKLTILLLYRPSHAGMTGMCPVPSVVLTQGLLLCITLASNSLCSWRWPFFFFLSEIRPCYIALAYLVDKWARLDLEFLAPPPPLPPGMPGLKACITSSLSRARDQIQCFSCAR